eukprot:CAMPEP_0169207808 /NCGR_PEP_ID=MMETSP1016-20121227/13788_1 /TAXON_ID=342587 /ORGANISM="Karlodinium micrum, Strain CCMP2283" /LENGTH=122 /DNA_ID=CAMNT_0009285125 /DNA_START=33 /DNA_END=398 /DNA_ORIENTATION=-
MVCALPAITTLALLLIAQPDVASARMLNAGSRTMEANANGQAGDESQHQATMADMLTDSAAHYDLLLERQAQLSDSAQMDLDGTIERKCNRACQARNRQAQALAAARARAAEAAAAARRAAE